MEFLANSQAQIIIQLILATFLGVLIGLEREIKRKEAGLQTYSLVALGTCLFTVIGFEIFNSLNFLLDKPGLNFDLSRVIQAIAVGIGFIGAGVIFRQSSGIVGLTTAAGLWATAAIGLAVGFQLYFLAGFATFLTLLILIGFGFIEKKYLK